MKDCFCQDTINIKLRKEQIEILQRKSERLRNNAFLWSIISNCSALCGLSIPFVFIGMLCSEPIIFPKSPSVILGLVFAWPLYLVIELIGLTWTV